MTDLPQNWVEVPFTKPFDIQGGTQPPKSSFIYEEKEGYIRLLQIRDFGKKPVPTYIPIKKTLKTCVDDDVLIARYGASIGRILTGMTGAYNVAIAKVLIPDNIDKRFVFHLLNSSYFQEPILSIERSAQDGFNKDDLSRIYIPLPPLNEQKRIVKKLDSIMPKIDEVNERLERIPLILKRARQSILNQAITGELTKDWRKEHSEIQSAKELIDTIQKNRNVKYDIAYKNAKANGIKKPKALFLPQYDELVSDNKNWVKCYIANIFSVETGATPLKSNASYYKDANIPWVKTGEVQNCEIFEAEEFITEKALRETNVKIFPKDTLLIAMYGEGKTRGQVGRLKFEATTNQACAALVNTDIAYLMNEYIFYYCLSQYNEIRRQAAGGNQPNLNLDKIKLWEIDIPPLEEQEEIVKQVKKAFEKLDKIEEQYKKAKSYTDKLTQSILHKAFKGNLVPQDPNDKPIVI